MRTMQSSTTIPACTLVLAAEATSAKCACDIKHEADYTGKDELHVHGQATGLMMCHLPVYMQPYKHVNNR